jgi:hypothetical protein
MRQVLCSQLIPGQVFKLEEDALWQCIVLLPLSTDNLIKRSVLRNGRLWHVCMFNGSITWMYDRLVYIFP